MKPSKVREYKLIQEKRQQRLASLLKRKNVVYCKSFDTALTSLANIYNLPEGDILSFLESFDEVARNYESDEFLKCFQRYFKRQCEPEFDGVIYFHNTSIPRKEFFLRGISQFEVVSFSKRVERVLRCNRKATRIYKGLSKSGDWGSTKPASDVVVCGTMVLDSRDDFTGVDIYRRYPERLYDFLADRCSDQDLEFLLSTYAKNTVYKVVSFYSEEVEYKSATLNGLIGYLLKCSGKISCRWLALDIGYNGSSINPKAVVGLNTFPRAQKERNVTLSGDDCSAPSVRDTSAAPVFFIPGRPIEA